MRDKRFVAEHRGGPLTKTQHRQLMNWACACAGHVLHYFEEDSVQELRDSLWIAKAWEKGIAPVGEAQKAAWKTHALARSCSDPVSVAVARAVGHAAATAHMSNHALGSALYALKAVKLSGNPADNEKNWQLAQLSGEIRHLVETSVSPAGLIYQNIYSCG